MSTVYVTARPRIHIALSDMGNATQRAYGGVGFSVDGLPSIWKLTAASDVIVSNIDKLDQLAQDELVRLAQLLGERIALKGFRAELKAVAPQHRGFGTKTTLCLSLIAAVCALHNLKLDRHTIQKLSGRGGASGVGVNLFFDGGIIWDGGHNTETITSILPSSARASSEVPPVLGRWPFPRDWGIALVLPEGVAANGAYEKAFFELHAPIPRVDALETVAIVCHGIVPGFATTNLELLRTSLIRLHDTGFKKREVDGQSTSVRSTLKLLQNSTDLAVGMSSMGPLLYCIFQRSRSPEQLIESLVAEQQATLLGFFKGWNTSYESANEHK
ncbi:MAG TPA: beta-ribofuranosylaminobenzene 5'-phosphate synthase family protein [Xanthobacteraceae bacterium]|nr:beta-ribofuranosylaminobenzene 5'-phosphate synthase family protein [Xanthobacteraceae bacterium]